jgi:tryptophanyl-tRNA synthetase
MSRVLTGDRPTGALHLGHYFGTLANRVRLQQSGHEVFVVIADYQVITDRDAFGDLAAITTAMVLDYLACGLDPDRTVIFTHSAVPALNQLMLPFLSLVSTGELNRNPTTKDEIRRAGREAVSGLMLTYPVHQAADVLFCQAELVPVGRDQLPHLELTRSIARRFAERYGPVFTRPEALLGEVPLLSGLDGQKMGKSAGNAIGLTDAPEVVTGKLRAARTDSVRQISFDPEGRPEVANLLRIAAACRGVQPEMIAADVGERGAAGLKAVVADEVNRLLAELHSRRSGYTEADARRIVERGNARANEIADQTLARVRAAMGTTFGTGPRRSARECVTVDQ